jgi:hypothetical protein
LSCRDARASRFVPTLSVGAAFFCGRLATREEFVLNLRIFHSKAFSEHLPGQCRMAAKKGLLPRIVASLDELCDADPQTSTQRPSDHAEGGAGLSPSRCRSEPTAGREIDRRGRLQHPRPPSCAACARDDAIRTAARCWTGTPRVAKLQTSTNGYTGARKRCATWRHRPSQCRYRRLQAGLRAASEDVRPRGSAFPCL